MEYRQRDFCGTEIQRTFKKQCDGDATIATVTVATRLTHFISVYSSENVQEDDETDGNIHKANVWMRMNDGSVIWKLINGNDKRRQHANEQRIYLFISSGTRKFGIGACKRFLSIITLFSWVRWFRIDCICIWVFRLFSVYCVQCTLRLRLSATSMRWRTQIQHKNKFVD